MSTLTASAALSGAGSLTAGATRTATVAAALSGAGGLTAGATQRFAFGTDLHGAGLLLEGTVSPGTFPGSATFPGSTTFPDPGGLAAGGPYVTTFPAVTFLGAGRLTAFATVAPPIPPTPVFPVPPGPVVHRPKPTEERLLVFDTVTGRVAYELPFTAMTWSSPLGSPAAGQMRCTLPVVNSLQAMYRQGVTKPRESLREFLTGPYRYSFAVCWGATVLWAGPYVPAYDPPNALSIDVAGVEIGKMFEKRVLLNPAGTGPYTDKSYDYDVLEITKPVQMLNLVSWALAGGPSRSLPIFCANPPSGVGVDGFHVYGYDLTTAAKAMQDLTAAAGGPDMRLDPYLYTGADAEYVAWNLVIGDPYLDTGTPATWDDSQVTIQRDITPSDMATTYYATGTGQDRDKLIAAATDTTLTNLGFPAIDLVDTAHTSETDLYQLGQYAAGDVAVSRAPIDQWTVRSSMAGFPAPGTFRPGDIARIDVRLHPIIEPGTYYKRITGIAQDGTANGWMSMICMDPEADWVPAKPPYNTAG